MNALIGACLLSSCLKIITIDTRPDDYGTGLRCTAYDHGWGEPIRLNRNGEIHNLTTRMQMLHRYVEGVRDEDVILYSDGWDVVVTEPPEVVLGKFSRFGAPIVMSAESNMWPDPEPHNHLYPRGFGEFQYANSGLFIGTGAALRAAFSKMHAAFGQDFLCSTYWGERREQADDMRCWHWFHVHSYPQQFALDQNATIFLNLNQVDTSLVGGQRSRPTYRGHHVSFLHANGNGKEGHRSEVTKVVAKNCRSRLTQYVAGEERY